MAENYGSRLLREIHEESLHDLLSALRTSAPTTASLGIGVLDEIYDETRAAFTSPPLQDEDFVALSSSQGLMPPDEDSRAAISGGQARMKSVPPVVEIKAVGPAEGKMQFLYAIAGELLLGHVLGLVIWIDCSGRFDILRLYDLMLGLTRNTTEQSESLTANSEADRSVSKALERLHVFRPPSSASLLAIVRDLRSYLLGLQDHPAGGLPVKAIVISEASSFYWEERWKEEEDKAGLNVNEETLSREEACEAPTEATPLKKRRLFSMQSYHAMLTTALSSLQSTFCCSVLLSSTSFHPLKFSPITGAESSEQQLWPSLRSPLPNPWAKFVNVEIVLSKQKPQKYRRGISFTEALAEKEARVDEAEGNSAKVRVWLDATRWLNACFPGQSLPANTDGTEGKRKYKMLISSHGVELRRDELQEL